jgi:hypothetical protein
MPLMVALSIAAHYGWHLWSFDVEAAFLTGKEMKREMIFRPPREGLDGLAHGSLIRAKKGLFGVPEAPRLWYLRLLEVAVEAGWERVPAWPCVLIVRSPGGGLEGILVIHVDDGLFAGWGKFFERAKKALLANLKVKHLHMDSFVYLRRKIERQTDGSINITFDLKDLKPIEISASRKKQAEDKVTESERSSLRTLIGEVSWPVREGFPEFVYDASDIQQRVVEATVGTLLRANAVTKQLKARAAEGPALRIPRGDGSGRFVVGLMADASFGRQPRGGSQQGFVVVLGDRRLVFEDSAPVAPVMWSSTRIKRVVRSTLAAEACAMTNGYDSAVYLRVFLARVLGHRAVEWIDEARTIPQITWTDCKSLLDMLSKEGSVPSEKRVALDVYDVQQYLGGDDIEWISTHIMIADPLTKSIARGPGKTNALKQFLDCGVLSSVSANTALERETDVKV